MGVFQINLRYLDFKANIFPEEFQKRTVRC